MRNFYRTTDQNNPTEIMVALMHKQDRFQPTVVPGIDQIRVPHPDFPALTALTLGAMTICNTVRLVASQMVRCSPQITAPVNAGGNGHRAFAVILHANSGALLMAKDEAIPIRSREVWNFDASEECVLVNKSEDDVFMLLIIMDVD